MLKNTTNYASIDQDNGVVDAWSFNVKQGEDLFLISAKGNPEFEKQQAVRSMYDEKFERRCWVV